MDTQQADAFLDTMFSDALDRKAGHIAIWSPQNKRSDFHTEIHTACASVTRRLTEGMDVYYGLGLHGKPSKSTQRGSATDGLLDELQYEPSMIVHSGHGFQVYWQFSEPWIFSGPEDQARAADAERVWVRYINAMAAKHGWKFDAVSDLARVFRVPGTKNFKDRENPADVLIHRKGGPVYHSGDLIEEAASAPLPTPVRHAAPSGPLSDCKITLSAKAEPPIEKLDALRENDRQFDKTWTAKRTMASPSEYDMSLASIAAACEWEDQEIVNLLIAGRRKRGDDLKLRLDYYRRTIRKARESLANQYDEMAAFDTLDDIVSKSPPEPLESPVRPSEKKPTTESNIPAASNTPPNTHDAAPISQPMAESDRQQLVDVVSKLFGFSVAQFIQRGREPRRAEYSLVLPGGREVLIGCSANVLSNKAFREAVMDAVGVIMPMFKPAKWAKMCKALMRIVHVEENPDLDRDKQVIDWLRRYIKDSTFYTDENWREAIDKRDPFVRDGMLYVSAQEMVKYLQTMCGVRGIDNYKLCGYLGTIGFTQKQITERIDGIPISRSYRRGSVDMVEIEKSEPLTRGE